VDPPEINTADARLGRRKKREKVVTAGAQLNKGALGLGESVVMGVAGTAPAFSVAATTATLIAALGCSPSAVCCIAG